MPHPLRAIATPTPVQVGAHSLNNALAAVQSPITRSALPTVSYNASAMSGAQWQQGVISGQSVPNPVFGAWGGANLGPLGDFNSYPNALVNCGTNASTFTEPNLTVEFYHSGSQLDIVHTSLGQTYDIWVDDQYLGHWAVAEASGTAQSATSSTIKLASGSSSTSNIFNTCYVLITGGTGAGQVAQITAYNGATLTATISPNWTTTPDTTSTYVVTDSPQGYYVPGLTGITSYINLNFGSVAARKIMVVTSNFYGVNIGPNDSVWAAPPAGAMRMIGVGDSIWAGTGRPFPVPMMSVQMARLLGWQEFHDGGAGSGWVAPGSFSGLNFMQRIAPPNEAWNIMIHDATGGTFTLSVTYNGTTQTTGNISYSNSNPNALCAATVSALTALSNLPAGATVVAANGDYPPHALRVLLYNMPGAAISINAASLTVSPITVVITRFTGVVAPNVPTDANGNPLPFVLYVQGSHNDTGYTAAQVQANATATAQFIARNFPTAIAIFTGIVSPSTLGGSGVIASSDTAFNAAIKAASAYLPTINGNLPYIETYDAGVGGNNWIHGGGNVGSPTTNANDILISALDGGAHPTGNGHSFLAARLAQKIKALLGAQ